MTLPSLDGLTRGNQLCLLVYARLYDRDLNGHYQTTIPGEIRAAFYELGGDVYLQIQWAREHNLMSRDSGRLTDKGYALVNQILDRGPGYLHNLITQEQIDLEPKPVKLAAWDGKFDRWLND